MQLTTSPFDFKSNFASGEELERMRAELYQDSGPGYVIIKNFLSDQQAQYLSEFWTQTPPPLEKFDQTTTPKLRIGQFPFVFLGKRRKVYRNYIWTQPFDAISHEICFSVTLLRNQLENQPLYRHLYPLAPRVASYRVVITDRVEGVEVVEHTDFQEPQYAGESGMAHILQATLFLSDYGVDYTGDGFSFQTNTGERVRFGPEVNVNPGDLVIWRYSNAHMVGSNHSLSGGKGFVRMLFPFEEIDVPPYRVRQSIIQAGMARLKKIFRFRN